MTKIVYNACHGRFSLSAKAVRRGKELSHSVEWAEVDEKYGWFRGARHDSALVRVVEELGDLASGRYAHLVIEDIPSGTQYVIDEYDGYETVVMPEDINWITAP